MHHLLNRFYLSFEILVPSPTILRHIRGFYVAFPRKFKLNNDPTSDPVNKKKYRDLLIALLCASRQYFVVLPSHFCGLWLVLRLKLNDVVALNWVADERKQIAAAFKWLYKYFTSSSTVFIDNSTFTVIIKLLHHWETPVEMVCLYNTSNCSFSVLLRPRFSLEAAVSVFASTSFNNSLKTVPQISKFGISSPNGSSDSIPV